MNLSFQIKLNIASGSTKFMINRNTLLAAFLVLNPMSGMFWGPQLKAQCDECQPPECEFMDEGPCCEPIKCPHQFYLGPEIYKSCRKREGGTWQDGWLYGARGGYDYIKRYCFYIGGDVLYAEGTLDGKSAKGNKLRSHMTDASIEGRFGYTFQRKHGRHASLTPFVSAGFFSEKNNYVKPSPIPVHFHTKYSYVGGGFLSKIDITRNLEGGVNLKIRWTLDPKCYVSHDPEFDDMKQVVEERFQYRVEIPFKYQFWTCQDVFVVGAIPFYEYRQYGHRANFPFDFFETEFNIYGITLELYYQF